MTRTVIIPAHNEESVLHNTLDTLLNGLPQDVAVIVACNGCTDRTVEIARSYQPRVNILTIDEASKTNALNRAEELVEEGPRAYVDADIQILGSDIAELFKAIHGGATHLAEPLALFDTGKSSPLVKAYYAVWVALHGAEPGDIGGGVYCLSVTGRSRFDFFPNVISDDGFVRWHFAGDEYSRVNPATTRVSAPRDIRSLVRIKTRSRLGTNQLKPDFPELAQRRRSSSRSISSKVTNLNLRTWLLVPLYTTVQIIVGTRARRLEHTGDTTWERDRSSRAAG